jgi:MYXO-CTERM domain-containing protein
MVSPFTTFEEFTAAKGPIYTFANSSGMVAFLLIICALMFLYFIYASFTTKRSDAPQNPVVLGLLLVTGFVSLLQGAYTQATDKASPASAESRVTRIASNPWQPMALLGLMGGGAAATRRRRSRKSVRTRLR